MVKKNMLNRKLRRDLWQNRMQIVAMVLLCALGTWVFSGLDAAWRMIDLSANTYFEQQNLADLWITLQGVDRNTVRQIQNIDGVQGVQARATAELETTLPDEPSLMVTAYDGAIRINQPRLFDGEALEPGDLRGCVLDRDFANANGLSVGDRLTLKLAGTEYTYVVRGLALEPEYLALSKNTTRDPKEYGFVLMNSRSMPQLPLSSLVVTFQPGADGAAVKQAVMDRYPEALIVDHNSHSATHGVYKDVNMFRNLSYLFPLLAYSVAAMIVLTTITRMLENQRTQMGTLKALGYHNRPMLLHYLSYAFYPSLIGSLIGLFVGRITLPYILWVLEEVQFSFPEQLQAPVSAAQWAVCALGVALACLICLRTYRKSAREQTAALLRPKPPKAGRKLLVERLPGLWGKISFNGKMIVRNLFRNKLRTLMSLIGVLCCTMLIITSLGLQDSVNYFVSKFYEGTLRYTVRAKLDSTAGDIESYRSRIQADRVEGVMDQSVSIRSNTHDRITQLTVLEDDQQLMYLGPDETWMALPQDGVLLSEKLSQVLNAGPGDTVELWFAGDDTPIRTTVAGIASVTVGQTVYMSRSMWKTEKKGGFTPTALLVLNPTEQAIEKLDSLDEVQELQYPPEQEKEMLKLMESVKSIFSLMSGAALGLAFVVLYNMGILNFMERYREYATLKVLGYHQKEIRWLIRVENDLVTLLGIVLGIFPGWWLTGQVLTSCESDTMVFASTVKPTSILIACVATYAFSVLITWLLTRKVKSIDMVEALKSVE